MNIILFEDAKYRNQLKPLTLTRPIGDLRLGILKINEKWEQLLNTKVTFLTESYLQKKFKYVAERQNRYVNSSFLPTPALVKLTQSLIFGEVIKCKGEVVAYCSDKFGDYNENKVIELKPKDAKVLRNLPDLFLQNADEISSDYLLLTVNRKSNKITDPHTRTYAAKNIFIEKDANLKACILNAENGPIYIGENAIVQEGAVIIGPAAICHNSMVAFGARIRPNTTLGPGSRVGGEVGNSIFYANSNKAHDGFLGNSYIGEWCNLGANTNNSNLKNNYKEVSLYNYNEKALVNSGEVFCGTFMGDFTKAGISTMFNTGTVIGVSANVFGAGFQAKFIPSFSWGGNAEGYADYRFDKAKEVINATLARREKELSTDDIKILNHILEHKPTEIA
jgi:UDP-N-acetylglucosamine diphosphorylase/glucosamine-1-phosphate N-acetyltransferase